MKRIVAGGMMAQDKEYAELYHSYRSYYCTPSGSSLASSAQPAPFICNNKNK